VSSEFLFPPMSYKFPCLILLGEKHEPRYLLCRHADELNEHLVKIVKDRSDDGCYFEPQEPAKFTVVEGVVLEKLSENVRLAYKNEKRNHDRAVADYEYDERVWKQIRFALDESRPKDERARAALSVLRNRKNYEYEGFEIVKPELAEPAS